MTTVIDALRNAQLNFTTIGRMGASRSPIFVIAMQQLENGIQALENGKAPNDVLQENLLSDVDTGKPKP